jgi:hypothetical protein
MCPHFLEYATRGSCVFNLTPTGSILSRKALFFFWGCGDEEQIKHVARGQYQQYNRSDAQYVECCADASGAATARTKIVRHHFVCFTSLFHETRKFFCYQSVPYPETPESRRNQMQSYLFIGGHQDGLNMPLADDADTIQLASGATGQERYIRDTLNVGIDAYITFYRHEELTPEQVLDHLAKHYRSWALSRPGSRQ